ncbi:Uncharacterised protein [Mycobacteroides abscessus subsp. abscessus]|nr:Uncharacterised protein [Mycobacteroides abscessus subsp. abscessus]
MAPIPSAAARTAATWLSGWNRCEAPAILIAATTRSASRTGAATHTSPGADSSYS